MLFHQIDLSSSKILLEFLSKSRYSYGIICRKIHVIDKFKGKLSCIQNIIYKQGKQNKSSSMVTVLMNSEAPASEVVIVLIVILKEV